MGVHFSTAEQYGWLLKLSWIMVAPDPGMTTQEFADALPSFEAVVTMSNAGLSHSYNHVLAGNLNLVALIAEACEKLGLHEQGLHFAEQAATNFDIRRGGTFFPSIQFRGFQTKGRCLAAMGELKKAEAAFESALASIADFEFFLLEILCLRDLKVLVLDKDGRNGDGSARLKAAIRRLLGETPASEQLTELKTALGDSLNLAATLA
jgi:tetratricopeptide (TPR) repeat protein